MSTSIGNSHTVDLGVTPPARTPHWTSALWQMRGIGLFRILRTNLFHRTHYYLMSRPLREVPETTAARSPITFRPGTQTDIDALVRALPDADPETRHHLLIRLHFYNQGFESFYIGDTPDGNLAYLQWLIRPDDACVQSRFFHRAYQPLRRDQVLVENAFCFTRYRGLGLLPQLTLQLLRTAQEEGYKWAVTYIRGDNLTSLRQFTDLGFRFAHMIREYKILGTRFRNIH